MVQLIPMGVGKGGPMGSHIVNRRSFLAGAAAVAFAPLVQPVAAGENAAVHSFFLVSDTHYLANKDHPSEMDARSAEICGRLVDTLNHLPGTPLPESVGGGTVIAPLGVIHGGDLIDSGDKTGKVSEEMKRTEFSAYEKDYGLSGSDGRLKFPVYEVHGNHDSPRSNGHVIDRLKERNKSRKGLVSLSANALHFSWDMGPLHFINVGITVGLGEGANARRRYNPAESLEFLKADLDRNAANGNRPAIITHHVDIQRYIAMKSEIEGVEWDPEDVTLFGKVLAPHNIAMVFYGHTHQKAIWKWTVENGAFRQALDVFNADNSSHFLDNNQAFLYVEASGKNLIIRECFTRDRWATYDWTPQVVRKEIMLAVTRPTTR